MKWKGMEGNGTEFHSIPPIPFHSTPFHSIPFRSITFHSISLHSIPFPPIPMVSFLTAVLHSFLRLAFPFPPVLLSPCELAVRPSFRTLLFFLPCSFSFLNFGLFPPPGLSDRALLRLGPYLLDFFSCVLSSFLIFLLHPISSSPPRVIDSSSSARHGLMPLRIISKSFDHFVFSSSSSSNCCHYYHHGNLAVTSL